MGFNQRRLHHQQQTFESLELSVFHLALRSRVDIDDLNVHMHGFSVSADPQGNRATNPEIFQLLGQIKGISDRLAIGAGDDIPDHASR